VRGRNVSWTAVIFTAIVFVPLSIAIGWWMLYIPMQESSRLQAEVNRIAAINSQIPERKKVEVTAAQEKILAESLPPESPEQEAEKVVLAALKSSNFTLDGDLERGESLPSNPWGGATPVEYTFSAEGPSARIPNLISSLEETFDYSPEDRVIQQRSPKPFIAVSGLEVQPEAGNPATSKVTVTLLVFNTSEFVEGLSDVRPQ
jgi:hypothetical protein